MAALTSIAAGIGIASSVGGSVMSFTQANKQKKLQNEAEAEADKAMASARARLDVNYMDALSIQKEPYELQREAMLAQGTQAIDAAQESERGTAAAAGRVQMAQNEAQGGIRTAMGKELADIERLKVAEEARLRDLQTQLDLGEVEGKQMQARNAQEMAAQATAQGFEGLTSAATQAANLVPLYGYKKGGNGVQTQQGLAKNAVGGVNNQLTGTGSNIQYNPIGAGMPTLNPNQQYQGMLANQMQSNPVTSFYPDFQVNPFQP
jgi:hypothetical protein